MTVKSRLLEFIRRDGPSDAPFVFLSIEDGGRMQNIEQLDATLSSDGVWQPETREPQSLGKPGQIISKMMKLFATHGTSMSEWQNYRDYCLYQNNEVNLKFYPVSRPKQKDWNEELASYTGLAAKEYMDFCFAQRPEILSSRYRDTLKNNACTIILGELEGWKRVLSNFYDITREEEFRNDKGKLIFKLFFDADGNLLYMYFPLFRLGISSSEIELFCREVLKHKSLSHLINIPS